MIGNATTWTKNMNKTSDVFIISFLEIFFFLRKKGGNAKTL